MQKDPRESNNTIRWGILIGAALVNGGARNEIFELLRPEDANRDWMTGLLAALQRDDRVAAKKFLSQIAGGDIGESESSITVLVNSVHRHVLKRKVDAFVKWAGSASQKIETPEETVARIELGLERIKERMRVENAESQQKTG